MFTKNEIFKILVWKRRKIFEYSMHVLGSAYSIARSESPAGASNPSLPSYDPDLEGI